MLIAVEGCIGVGKSTFVRLCEHILPCHTVYEVAKRNLFLAHFFQAQHHQPLREHMQYISLLLQERQWRLANQTAQKHLVLCDFHPLRSLVLAQLLLSLEQQQLFSQHYRALALPSPDITIYLKANEEVLLSRIRNRNDPYRDHIDMTSLLQILHAYENFFRSYKEPYVTLETSHLDGALSSQRLLYGIRKIIN